MAGKTYSVGDIASLSGVTVRTLHHYDAIGLLSPTGRSTAGYRLYGEHDVDRLQQILFYRELGFSLARIREILDDEGTDALSHLEHQRTLLTGQLKRVEAMAAAVQRAIDARRRGEAMSAEEKLGIFGMYGIPRVASGKVREMFDAGDDLLMVATDRISVFDVVLPTPIPDKGAVLNGLSVFWFERTKSIVGNHLVAWRLREFPDTMRSAELAGRSMLVRRAQMVPLECVVRGYITGSGWKDYQKTGEVCGHKLPTGLLEAQQLPEPLFTPSTKALTGHDENITVAQAKEIVGDASLVDRIADVSIRLYEQARDYSASRGIILADTKYEFGLVDGELLVGDELFTPDSSRYWPADEWEPGTNPPSFDKQYVRDYAETVNWDKTDPGPELPDDVVAGTTARYREAYERITGRSFDDYMREAG